MTTTEELNELRGDDGKLPSYAWPGGYQMHYYTRDGLTVCPDCANKEVDDGQAVVAGEVFWEGPDESCDDCGGLIPSAYGDPDASDAPLDHATPPVAS